MDHYSILDSAPSREDVQVPDNHASPPVLPSVSAGIAAANAVVSTTPATRAGAQTPGGAAGRPFGDDATRSLAEMAERDLDAALQLLAERAQYITGASGAAIALRRSHHNDMLCRANAGSTAPELGALLSTEQGLSGESVRTRQALRCDDTDRDPRVNRDCCRQLGIRSVVVMPIVGEREVLGVFELFSGKPLAFDERDLSALQRLGQMVERAVRHTAVARIGPITADVAEVDGELTVEVIDPEAAHLEQRATGQDVSAWQTPTAVIEHDSDARAKLPRVEVLAVPAVSPDDGKHVKSAHDFAGAEISIRAAKDPVKQPATASEAPKKSPSTEMDAADAAKPVVGAGISSAETAAAKAATPAPAKDAIAAAVKDGVKKPLFWSAAMQPPSAPREAQGAQSPATVPAVLRALHQCKACGFPVSQGRTLCVECEEKQWRGKTSNKAGA